MTQQQPRLDVPHGCDFGFGSVEDQLSLAVEQVADDRFCGLPEPRVEDAVVFGAHRDFGSGNGVIPTWHVITEHTVLRPDLSFETHNSIDFTGTVTTNDGTVLGTGTLLINFDATGSFLPDPGSFVAHFEIVDSGGGLAGLHGNGTVTGVPGVPGGNGTATGTVHF